ncbi:MAG: 4Fe-4S binding protein [Candidatus Limiplasma sp.]|nr:4Fe-4S binding protein [Candidatus Limiplasma sp.]
MAFVFVDKDVCKGCGLCKDACPKHIMELPKDRLNKKGYHPAMCVDQEACIACAFCAMMCPDAAITVEK